MTRTVLIAILLAIAAPASALTPVTQPAEERARQQLLPQSADPIWRTFAHTRVKTDLNRGIFLAEHPADVRALDGQQVSVTGFMLSTSILKKFGTFILTRYTPVCAFCPPGAPNEAVQVNLLQFVGQTSGLVTVKGRLHLENDASAGLFFRLDQAQIVSRS
ncbi:MAG TPA: DUF3299 domain-containing protein [Caulobacteraceae bacterium]|nr:DUF3299 domain-containing protein [Caulobacteraceae bacterium]